MTETFVGRQPDILKLQKVLLGENRARGSLSIASLEGPGGIGKTALFDQAMATTHLQPRRFLTLRVASKDNLGVTSGFPIIDSFIQSAKADAIAQKPAGYYFPNTKLALTMVTEIRTLCQNEIDRRFPSDNELKAVLNRAIEQLLAEGKPLAEFAAAVKKRGDFTSLEKRLEASFVDRSLRSFKAVRAESRWLPKFLPDFQGASMRNSVRENALKTVADALLLDLSKLLAGKSKLDGIDRLLIIIDDYEFLMKHIGEWLVRYFLPGLRDAGFSTTAFILGRDKLGATHPYWNKELAPTIVERISLKVLELSEFVELCRFHGVDDAATRDRIWKDTSGYPYLIRLWLDELAESRDAGLDGPSALMLKTFYDRTTRFMSEEQRGWLDRLLFLDDINKRSLRAFFQDSNEVNAVQEWFESEPSIRDPNSATFRVRDQLRSRLKEYLRRRDPDQFEDWTQKGVGPGK